MSREFTKEEVVEMFLERIRNSVNFWSNTNDSEIEKLNGLAFSILNIIDGTSGLPAFDLKPHPHEDDKQYCIEEGENYFGTNIINDDVYLHELYYKKED